MRYSGAAGTGGSHQFNQRVRDRQQAEEAKKQDQPDPIAEHWIAAYKKQKIDEAAEEARLVKSGRIRFV